MSGGGKGGSSTTQVKIPAWLESAAQSNLARADALAQIGYTPYYGPDVATMTPAQIAAMQNTGGAASAFGLAAPVDAMAGMPQAQQFAGGVQGYSSAPMFEQSLAALEASRPGQYAALNAPFIDPVTGAQPAAPFGTGSGGMGGGKGGAIPTAGGGMPMRAGSSDRSAAETAALYGSPRTSGSASRSGTGSFGLPDPMSGRFAGTNLPGVGGSVINSITRR